LRPTDNGADGHLWMENLAACGAYVICIERDNWADKINNWGEDVMGVYQSMVKNPRVDKQRVFLFGISSETVFTSAFLTNSPNLWKGVVFLSPTELPDYSHAEGFDRMPKIIISVGGEENYNDRLEKFQSQALNSGVLVENVIHPGEKHYVLSNAALRERNRAFTKFIFEE
jgi:dienelactone hydrolase